jgi:hypothetical protein
VEFETASRRWCTTALRLFFFKGRLDGYLNSLVALHKSIFSGEFYKDVVEMPARSVLLFLVLVCLGTSLICGLSHTFYAFDKTSGLAERAAAVLGGMEISGGTLIPHRQTPYVPESLLVSGFLEALLFLPRSYAHLPDSFVIVDTSARALSRASPNAMVLLTARSLTVNPGSPFSYSKNYSELLGGTDLVMDEQALQNVLLKWAGGLAVFYCLWTGVTNAGVFLVSIAFLTFAAYIFRLERSRRGGEFLKIASFAASPVYVGTNLVALSGTTVAWTWHVLILVSTFVMFRGVQRTSRSAKRPDIQE